MTAKRKRKNYKNLKSLKLILMVWSGVATAHEAEGGTNTRSTC
jgi:hypothetical protein